MKFEEAMQFLRDGFRIFRDSNRYNGSLCETEEKALGSFYLTIFDVLANDWMYCLPDQDPNDVDEE